jgi:hypothetical protein
MHLAESQVPVIQSSTETVFCVVVVILTDRTLQAFSLLSGLASSTLPKVLVRASPLR